jgi:hypothetical protein
LQTNIDAKRAEIKLNQAHFDFEKQQADAAMKYKAASDAADRQLQIQLHSGTAQGGGEFQKAVTNLMKQQSDIQTRAESIQEEINHTNQIMQMTPKDFQQLQVQLQVTASDTNQPAQVRQQAVKDINAYKTLTAHVPNPVAGQPDMMAGHLYAQTLQSHWNDLQRNSEQINQFLKSGQDKLTALNPTGDASASAKAYLKSNPAGSTKVATVPPAKTGAKGVAPVTPPAGVKRSAPAPPKTTAKPSSSQYSIPGAGGAILTPNE